MKFPLLHDARIHLGDASYSSGDSRRVGASGAGRIRIFALPLTNKQVMICEPQPANTTTTNHNAPPDWPPVPQQRPASKEAGVRELRKAEESAGSNDS